MWHRVRSLVGRWAVVAFGTAAVFSSTAGAALPGTTLADGRGYQLVSPASKNSGRISAAAISPDGSRVAFPIAQGPSTGAAALFLSQPSGSGWAPKSMMPPAGQLLFNGQYSMAAWTRSLSAFFSLAHPGLLPPFPSALLRLDGSGNQSVLASFAVDGGISLSGAVSSADGSHVAGNVSTTFDPDHVPDTFNVYDFGSDPPVLVSRLPSDSVPACGDQGPLGSPGFAAGAVQSSAVQHWVSDDGSRVFFLTPGDVCDGSVPAQLYVRDRNANGGAGATTLISGPTLSGPDGDATFMGASADGSQAIYATSARLTADDTNSDPDIYRFTFSGPDAGNKCLTCLVPDANVFYNQTNGGGVAASEDLSHVYFTSDSQLVAGKGTPGVDNLYVWHKDPTTDLDRIDWIAPGQTTGLHNNPVAPPGSALTPDGNVLVFVSHEPGLDALTPGQTNGGFAEVYRYDDRTQDPTAGVTCISCPAGGVAPTVDADRPLMVANAQVSDTRMMSDDGNTIFFSTTEPLVPQDVNGSDDIYEWRDGQIVLISDGVTPQLLFDADLLMGTNTSGNDVFFLSFSHLTGDQLDDSNQLYDAKIGATSSGTTKSHCLGEGCQGPLSAPPARLHAGSATLTGSGNVVARIGIAHITAAQRRAFARTGKLTLAIGLTVPGRLSIAARGKVGRHTHTLAAARRITHHPGVVRIGLRLTRAARRQLAAHRSLHMTLTIHCNKIRHDQHIAMALKPTARTGRN